MKPPRNKPLEAYAQKLGLYVLQFMLDTPDAERFKSKLGEKVLRYMKGNRLTK